MNDKLYTLIPWDRLRDLIKMNFDINFNKIDDLCIPDIKWFSLENWLNADDLEILQCLESLYPFWGELMIVTDASYTKELSPFMVNSVHIGQFVKNHFSNFNQHFLETDAFIINFESKIAWLFHHEGIYGLAKYNKK